MSTLKATNLQHKDSSDPNVVLHADGSTSIRDLQQLGTNYLINGGCLINQRNTGSAYSANNASIYTLDRWRVRNNGAPPAVSVSQIDLTSAPPAPGLIRAIRLQNAASGAAAPNTNDYVGITQMIEQSSSRALGFGGDGTQDVSVSFWIRSSLAATYTMSFISPGNTWSYLHDFTVSAGTWTYVTHTLKASDSADFLKTSDTDAGVVFGIYLAAGSNFTSSTTDAWVNSEKMISSSASNNFSSTASATVDFTGFCLTATSQPIVMPLEDIPASIRRCQRYYQRVQTSGVSITGTFMHSDAFYTTLFPFAVSMRASPDGSFVGIPTGGQFYWVDPGQTTFSSASTAGLTFFNSPFGWKLKQTRQGTGAAQPVKFQTYQLEASTLFAFDAEF